MPTRPAAGISEDGSVVEQGVRLCDGLLMTWVVESAESSNVECGWTRGWVPGREGKGPGW
jgi:hypothetical protein